MEVLSAYVSMDRREVMERGGSIPDRAGGAAVFADISGFTPLTEALSRALGARRGVEELTGHGVIRTRSAMMLRSRSRAWSWTRRRRFPGRRVNRVRPAWPSSTAAPDEAADQQSTARGEFVKAKAASRGEPDLRRCASSWRRVS